ncbi:hypothetical protein [Leptolyngbya sp. PCC 6406]|uniref:hypothetical protein n=1 Tax=Leptolyngbya sp. PCC 6406 TaxID=1173264 RepID=UPI0002ABE106|nr:hypothetical protein [Leptolyngbya sp. PCC 6406]
MKTVVAQSPMDALKAAMQLAQSVENQGQAHEAFHQLYEETRADNPEFATMLQMLWREYVATQRSAAFWQELCQVEKHLSERITESHIQLRQNYLRLMQEQ